MQLLEQNTPTNIAVSAAGYMPFTDIGGASALDAEILAFGLCNARLAKAQDPRARIDALHKNQQLWSLLVRDLAAESNHLPIKLKQELIELGFWSMRYGILASNGDLPLEPLMTVNRNILEGLQSQRRDAHPVLDLPTRPAAPPTAANTGHLNASA
jgi:flagellar protein FlaF